MGLEPRYVLYGKLNGSLFLPCHHQQRPHKVIPVSHKIKDQHSGIYRSRNWRKDDPEKCLHRTAPVNGRCLQKVIWHIQEKLAEHIDAEAFRSTKGTTSAAH